MADEVGGWGGNVFTVSRRFSKNCSILNVSFVSPVNTQKRISSVVGKKVSRLVQRLYF